MCLYTARLEIREILMVRVRAAGLMIRKCPWYVKYDVAQAVECLGDFTMVFNHVHD